MNYDTKVTITCPEHGDFEQRAGSHLQGSGCPKCHHNKLSLDRRSTIDIFIQKANNIHNNFYNYSKVKYINNSTKVIIICPIHGEFLQTPGHHIDQQNGCPKCKSSKGEDTIEIYLKNKNIIYEKQKSFPNCKYKKSLRFDFYLPNHNLCIEFDGPQHYGPSYPKNNIEKAKEIFELTKLRDNIKTQYCLDNDIKLLRISYLDFKNIIQILNSKLII